MASSNWVIVILEFSIIIHLAHADFRCGNQGTYTQNSAYQRNLNDTLSNLTRTDNAGDGFFNASSNSPQDNAYALALCPGHFNPTNCLQCVKSASEQLPQDCPNEKKATGWYEDTCMLGYSNSSFDMNRNDVLLLSRESYMSDWDSVVDPLRNLSKQLLSEAASDDYNTAYYSNGANLQRSSGYIAINVTMQCIPDISRKICGECLVNAATDLVTCCRGTSEVVGLYRYSCFLRYTIIPAVNVPVTILPPVPPTDPPTMQPLMPPPNPPSGGKGSHIIGPVIAAAAVTLAFSTLFIFQKVRKICSKKGQEEELFDISDDETGEIIYFRLNEIKAATSNFSDANKLGQGGFGHVYRGELSDGKKIAVKRLSNNSRQGMREFKTEVKLIIKLQHKNLVRLLGCCMKGNERLLVYEYMPNSSLDKYLFDPKKAKELDWAKRVNIVNGIAKGLRYLHEDSRLKIIHRDLKASNILLDEEMNPKISDFGLARIFGSNQIEANTNRVVGTYGYMAPEYAMEGIFSIKSDVYSFGVLLLEIISGKINSRLFHQEHDQNLLSYVWMLWEEHKAEQLIDENLNDDCPVNEALKWIRIALFCVEVDPKDRPTMSSIASMLEGEWKSLSEPKPPMSFGHLVTSDQSSTTWNDQSSTTYNGDDSWFYS